MTKALTVYPDNCDKHGFEPIENLDKFLRNIVDFHGFASHRIERLPDDQVLQLARHSLNLEADGWILRGRALLVLRRRAVESGNAAKQLGGRANKDTQELGLTQVTRRFAVALKIHPATAYRDARMVEIFGDSLSDHNLPREVYSLAAAASPGLRRKILLSAAKLIRENNFDWNEFRRRVSDLKRDARLRQKMKSDAENARRVSVELSAEAREILAKLKKGLANVAGFDNDSLAITYALKTAWSDVSKRQCRTLVDVTDVDLIRKEKPESLSI